MDKNEAEEVVKNTIEYANEEIKKSKKRYLKIFLSCLLALFVCVAIMFIIYKSNDKVRDVYAVVFVTDIDKMEMSEGDIIKEIKILGGIHYGIWKNQHETAGDFRLY